MTKSQDEKQKKKKIYIYILTYRNYIFLNGTLTSLNVYKILFKIISGTFVFNTQKIKVNIVLQNSLLSGNVLNTFNTWWDLQMQCFKVSIIETVTIVFIQCFIIVESETVCPYSQNLKDCLKECFSRTILSTYNHSLWLPD